MITDSFISINGAWLWQKVSCLLLSTLFLSVLTKMVPHFKNTDWIREYCVIVMVKWSCITVRNTWRVTTLQIIIGRCCVITSSKAATMFLTSERNSGLCEFDVGGKIIEEWNIFKTCHNIRWGFSHCLLWVSYDMIPTKEVWKKNWWEKDWRMWYIFCWDDARDFKNEVWTLNMDTSVGQWYTWLHFKKYMQERMVGGGWEYYWKLKSGFIWFWWFVWSQKHASVTTALFVMLVWSRLAVCFTFLKNKILSCLHTTLSVAVLVL